MIVNARPLAVALLPRPFVGKWLEFVMILS